MRHPITKLGVKIMQSSTIIIGIICWFFFSLALIGCSSPTEAPEESYSQDFCYVNDSIYKVEGKRYKVGKTERATIWIDSSGNLWRHGKDGKIIPVDYSDTEKCGN